MKIDRGKLKIGQRWVCTNNDIAEIVFFDLNDVKLKFIVGKTKNRLWGFYEGHWELLPGQDKLL